MATNVEIVKTVEDGHNVIITGQAGTGKSFIINELYQLLVRQGKTRENNGNYRNCQYNVP